MTSTTRPLVLSLMVAAMVLSSCAKGPIGADTRLGPPGSFAETRKALINQHQTGVPHCLRNRTGHSVQFEMRTTPEAEWQRWILPSGRIMQVNRRLEPEIRFVSVPVAGKSPMPGNEARLVHYRLDPDPPLGEVLPERACLHEFRPRTNGMLDLFLNSDLAI